MQCVDGPNPDGPPPGDILVERSYSRASSGIYSTEPKSCPVQSRDCREDQGCRELSRGNSWQELLQTLEDDSWGRPYLIVINRLRARAPPLTEVLDPKFVRHIIGTLFFKRNNGILPVTESRSQDWSGVLKVTEELLRAVRRDLRGNAASGPDGFHKKVFALAWPVLAEEVRKLFTSYLKLGLFPHIWRRISLVFFPKD